MIYEQPLEVQIVELSRYVHVEYKYNVIPCFEMPFTIVEERSCWIPTEVTTETDEYSVSSDVQVYAKGKMKRSTQSHDTSPDTKKKQRTKHTFSHGHCYFFVLFMLHIISRHCSITILPKHITSTLTTVKNHVITVKLHLAKVM